MPDDKQVAAAIHWLVKFETSDLGLEERQAFERWIADSPQHALAWEQLGRASEYFTQSPHLNAEEALHSISESERRLHEKRRSLKTLASLGGLGLAVWLSRDYTGIASGLNQLGCYAYGRTMADRMTAVGEQQQLLLQDGAQLFLNTQYALDIDFNARPEITLHYGEMALQESSGAWLRAGASLLKPTPGSEFSVFLETGLCRVHVVTGSLACLFDSGESASTVHGGQGLMINTGRHQISRFTPDANSLSWRKGLVTAEKMRLGRFVDELARYRPGYLSCADDVANLTLSGSFLVADTNAILDNISQILPIRQRRISDYWVRLVAA